MYKHPTTETELEGTLIVKKDGKYVWLSDNADIHNRIEMTDHDKIKEMLQFINIEDEFEFELQDDGTERAWMDA